MIETMDCWITGLLDCDCVRTEFTEYATRNTNQQSRVIPLLHYSITPLLHHSIFPVLRHA